MLLASTHVDIHPPSPEASAAGAGSQEPTRLTRRGRENLCVPLVKAASVIAGFTRQEAAHHGVGLIVEAVREAGADFSIRDFSMALVALRCRLMGENVPGFATRPAQRGNEGTRAGKGRAARTRVLEMATRLAPARGSSFKVADLGGSDRVNAQWARRLLAQSGLFRFERREGLRKGVSAWFAVRI